MNTVDTEGEGECGLRLTSLVIYILLLGSKLLISTPVKMELLIMQIC